MTFPRLILMVLLSVECGSDALTIGNAQLVKAFCNYVGCPSPDMSTLPPVAMRLEVKQGVDDALIIDDSYSCDIDSLTIALDYLNSVAQSRRKVVILSDILQSELSEDVLYTHVAQKMAQCEVELFIGVGSGIMAQSSAFTMQSRFFATTECLLENIEQIDIYSLLYQ